MNAPITVTGPPPVLPGAGPHVQARFDADRYNEQVFDKGNRATLQITAPCPCAGELSGSPLGTCLSCGGHGYVVVESRAVHVLISGMNAGRKQLAWSEQLVGTSSITVHSGERITVGDRIVNLSAEGEYTERLPKAQPGPDGGLVLYPTYAPLRVRHLLAFISPRQALRTLRYELGHYALDEATGAVRILPAALLAPDTQFSIRYTHHPTFQIIDMPRDLVYTPTPGNNPRQASGAEQALPQHAVGRRLHYLPRPARPGQVPLLVSTPKPADPLAYIAQSHPA
jgi:hypothetical protein